MKPIPKERAHLIKSYCYCIFLIVKSCSLLLASKGKALADTRLAGISRDVKARSGHGSPSEYEVSESDAADPSEAFSRWEKASVPEKPRQDSRR